MADPIVGWYAAGAGLIGAGAVAAGIRAIVLARRPAVEERHSGWDEHLDELVSLRTADTPTEVIAAVAAPDAPELAEPDREEPAESEAEPRRGRHWEDTVDIAPAGWRLSPEAHRRLASPQTEATP